MEIILRFACFILTANVVNNCATAPQNLAVTSGEPMIMTCGLNDWKNNNASRWKFSKAHTINDDLIYNGLRKTSKFANFTINEQFDLRKEVTNLEDAGIYKCHVSPKCEYRANLIVIASGPVCQTNPNASNNILHLLDTIHVWCTVSFRGNWYPSINWTVENYPETFPEQVNNSVLKFPNKSVSLTSAFTLSAKLNTFSWKSIRLRSVTYFEKITWEDNMALNIPYYQYFWVSPNIIFQSDQTGTSLVPVETVKQSTDGTTMNVLILVVVVAVLVFVVVFAIISIRGHAIISKNKGKVAGFYAGSIIDEVNSIRSIDYLRNAALPLYLTPASTSNKSRNGIFPLQRSRSLSFSRKSGSLNSFEMNNKVYPPISQAIPEDKNSIRYFQGSRSEEKKIPDPLYSEIKEKNAALASLKKMECMKSVKTTTSTGADGTVYEELKDTVMKNKPSSSTPKIKNNAASIVIYAEIDHELKPPTPPPKLFNSISKRKYIRN